MIFDYIKGRVLSTRVTLNKFKNKENLSKQKTRFDFYMNTAVQRWYMIAFKNTSVLVLRNWYAMVDF